MGQRAQPGVTAGQRESRASRVAASLVACLGITITVAAFLSTRHLERKRLESDFRGQAAGLVAAVQTTVDLYTEELYSIGRLYAASNLVERHEFRAFVQGILSHRLAVQALIWAPRVSGRRRVAFEKSARQEGLREFRFADRSHDRSVIPSPQRSEYYPIWYLEPAAGDDFRLGLDLGTDPIYWQALAEARDSGNLVATGRTTLGGGLRPPVAIALVLSVYQRGTSLLAGQELRRAGLLGFVVVVLRLDDLVAEALSDPTLSGLRLQLVDGRGSGVRLLGAYPLTAGTPPGAPARPPRAASSFRSLHYAAQVVLPQRRWVATVTAGPQYVPASRMWWSQAVVALGLILTVLSAAYVSVIAGRAAWAGRLLAMGTAELSQANEQLQREMAERIRNEDALRTSEERFRLLVETMNEGLSVLDEDSTMRYVNDALCRTLGYLPQEMLGRMPGDFLNDPNRAILQDQLARRRAGEDAPYELEWTAKDGRQVPMIVSPRAVFDDAGRYAGSFAVLTDITRLKQTQQELAQASAELRRSNAELEAFAYIASHDLQEPLRKVRAFGDRLEVKCAAALNEQGRDYLQRMQNAAARMQDLISDLLTFSRITTRGQPFVPVDLAQVAQEVASDLETRIEQVQGRVSVGSLPTLDADPLQMRQLLQNLIGNALKFHREGVPPVVAVRAEVTPGASPAEATCRLVIEDNGAGFDMEQADRIFGMFQRLHGRGEYEGSGVGLAICRKIAERHGGAIEAQSTPGRGSTFTVTLPMRHAREEPPSGPTG